MSHCHLPRVISQRGTSIKAPDLGPCPVSAPLSLQDPGGVLTLSEPQEFALLKGRVTPTGKDTHEDHGLQKENTSPQPQAQCQTDADAQ